MKILFILLFILNAFSIVAQKKKTYFDKATTFNYHLYRFFWNPYMTILLSEFMKLKEMRLTPI